MQDGRAAFLGLHPLAFQPPRTRSSTKEELEIKRSSGNVTDRLPSASGHNWRACGDSTRRGLGTWEDNHECCSRTRIGFGQRRSQGMPPPLLRIKLRSLKQIVS